ncbi:hypothetical protein KR009_003945 [Drosophila setifemur]|nr:hypothetical protein KR009_003945 [Drosophila setifemur]
MCFFSCVTRFIFFVYGTLGPAYHTYKTLNSGDDEFLAWAKYWIVYAFLVSIEVLADTFLIWLPLYMPTKLLLVLCIVVSAPAANVWMFDAILRPVLSKRQEQIDHFLHRGKDKLLSDILETASQLLIRSQNVALPFISHMWARSTTALRSSRSVVDAAAKSGEDSESPTGSDVTSAHNLSSGSSPIASSTLVVEGDDNFNITDSKASIYPQDNLKIDQALNEPTKKIIMSLDTSSILQRRFPRKQKLGVRVNDGPTPSRTNLSNQRVELFDDVENMLAKSKNEVQGQDVRLQRQNIGRRRMIPNNP